jgi:hypothetical protein
MECVVTTDVEGFINKKGELARELVLNNQWSL